METCFVIIQNPKQYLRRIADIRRKMHHQILWTPDIGLFCNTNIHGIFFTSWVDYPILESLFCICETLKPINSMEAISASIVELPEDLVEIAQNTCRNGTQIQVSAKESHIICSDELFYCRTIEIIDDLINNQIQKQS